ncbi:nuclear transport factor 2 family protein [Nocardioides sp. R1-1]|uniref:nuclear transport factor 2 family protein n=1 Tax=Nocardioides sp. R1-1 TaxID=3383502 RepID=UPI0038D09C3B
MTLTNDDRIALDDLVHRYALLVDGRDFAAVGALFTADALLHLPDPPAALDPSVEVRGRAAIVEALGRLTGFAATFHAVVGRIADPLGPDRASGRVACEAHHVSVGDDGATRDLTWYLHYADEYARADGRWLIARRALTVEAIATAPVRRVRTLEA